MDATDFIQGADIYNLGVYSDVKVECQYKHYQMQIEPAVYNTNLQTSLFDVHNDSDDSRNVKVEMVEEDLIINSNATEDESMAVEALRQLGSGTMYTGSKSVPRIETKTPQDLPLLPCTTCQLEFRTTADLNNHLAICKHIHFKCHTCNKIFERKLDLNSHILSHLEEQYLCRICSSQFKDKKELSTHMLTHGNITLMNQCPVCGNLFNRPSSLTNHMKIHTYQAGRAILNIAPKILETTKLPDIHGSEIIENINKKTPLPSLNNLIWNLCYDVNEQDSLSSSFDNGSDIVSCVGRKDLDSTVNGESADGPLRNNSSDSDGAFIGGKGNKRPHTCIYCNKAFAREKALLSHLKLHSDLLENYYQCEVCEGYFNNDSSLQKHQAVCRTQLQLKDSSKLKEVTHVKSHVSGEQKQQGCKSNDKISAVKGKVNKHGCEECGKLFSTRQKLGRHMWIHRKKIHTCEICLDTFDKQDSLDSHRLSMHCKSSPYVCTECGKNFSSRQGLWEHSRIHGDESNLYKCSECLKTFSSRQGYLIHKRKHSDERPYGCRFCWKTFRDGGTLRKHERIHTGERPHACPLCSKAFNQKVVLREHVRWLHTANKQPSEDGFYYCTLCDLKVSDKEVLCAHIVKHSDKMALLAKDNLKNVVSESEAVKKNLETLPKVSTNDVQTSVQKMSETADGDVLSFIQDFVDTEGAVECDLCNDKFFNKNDLSEHVQIHI